MWARNSNYAKYSRKTLGRAKRILQKLFFRKIFFPKRGKKLF